MRLIRETRAMPRRRFLQGSLAAMAAAYAAADDAEGVLPQEDQPAPDPPPFPAVDTHVHFWDPAHLRYPWLDHSELLNRPYLPEDYARAAPPEWVEHIVFVQAACVPEQDMAEAEWVSSLAEDDPRIRAIVASAPLEQGGGVLPVLEHLAVNPLLRGIRRMLQGEEPAFCLQPDFVEGTRLLERVNFTFDMGVRREQLPAVTELARQCPEVRFMLNHIGVPDLRSGELDPWQDHIRTLAGLPNVCCKLSGVATAADHENWTLADVKPAIGHVLECFGFNRTAFGSDWPVMLLAVEFRRWMRTVLDAVKGCSEQELRRLLRDTAIEFYRIEASPGQRA
jgi:L-fuconolactonase